MGLQDVLEAEGAGKRQPSVRVDRSQRIPLAVIPPFAQLAAQRQLGHSRKKIQHKQQSTAEPGWSFSLHKEPRLALGTIPSLHSGDTELSFNTMGSQVAYIWLKSGWSQALQLAFCAYHSCALATELMLKDGSHRSDSLGSSALHRFSELPWKITVTGT